MAVAASVKAQVPSLEEGYSELAEIRFLEEAWSETSLKLIEGMLSFV